jgi:predicted amidophosphoribosyltransferase
MTTAGVVALTSLFVMQHMRQRRASAPAGRTCPRCRAAVPEGAADCVRCKAPLQRTHSSRRRSPPRRPRARAEVRCMPWCAPTRRGLRT